MAVISVNCSTGTTIAQFTPGRSRKLSPVSATNWVGPATGGSAAGSAQPEITTGVGLGVGNGVAVGGGVAVGTGLGVGVGEGGSGVAVGAGVAVLTARLGPAAVGLAITAGAGPVAVGVSDSGPAVIDPTGDVRPASFKPQTMAVATTITISRKSKIRTVADRRRVAATNGPGRSISRTNSTHGRGRGPSSTDPREASAVKDTQIELDRQYRPLETHG